MGWVKGRPMDVTAHREGIGERITTLRLARNMTQGDLAKMCNLNRVSIQQYEVGRYTPGTNNLQKIADSLGTTTEYLVSGDEYRKHYQTEYKPWRTMRNEPNGKIYCPYCGKGNGYKIRDLRYDCLPMPSFCAWCGRRVENEKRRSI